jgi:hypothetical protein
MSIEFIKWAVGLLLIFWSLYKSLQTGKGHGYI